MTLCLILWSVTRFCIFAIKINTIFKERIPNSVEHMAGLADQYKKQNRLSNAFNQTLFAGSKGQYGPQSKTQISEEEYVNDNEKSNVDVPWKKKSKKISNDQELIQSDPISCPQNQTGNNT